MIRTVAGRPAEKEATMIRKLLPALAMTAALLVTPATARAQFFRGNLMPFPSLGFSPFGLPFVTPGYYPYGYYPTTIPLYQDLMPRYNAPVLPSQVLRSQQPANRLTGRPHQKIEEFDVPTTSTPAAANVPDKEGPATLEVKVPAGAEVWFDGKKNTETGTVRHFESSPLLPGVSSSFEVRVRVKGAAQDTDDIRHVTLRAGEKRTLDVMPRPEGAITEKR
jgi:uncharacterized protein (TIGR03000 family)